MALFSNPFGASSLLFSKTRNHLSTLLLWLSLSSPLFSALLSFSTLSSLLLSPFLKSHRECECVCYFAFSSPLFPSPPFSLSRLSCVDTEERRSRCEMQSEERKKGMMTMTNAKDVLFLLIRNPFSPNNQERQPEREGRGGRKEEERESLF